MEQLNEAGVQVLVDVRLNAISRRKGFSKTALSEALSAAGISYRHERELGNPKDNREAFRQGVAAARRRYLSHLDNGAGATYTAVTELATTTTIALLCYEREHSQCHRSCILDRAVGENPGLQVLKL